MSIRRSEPNREYTGLAGMEGRLRTKLEGGDPLDAKERAYLAGLRGARDVTPAKLRMNAEQGKPVDPSR